MNKNDNKNIIFEVNLNSLLEAGISINQFFFLQLSNNGDISMYKYYLEQFPQPINKADVETLIEKGLLYTKDGTDRFTFENLTTTSLYKKLFSINNDNVIEELMEAYPKKTPLGRRLQSDGPKWKPKYLSIVKSKPGLHEIILKCIAAEEQQRKKAGQLEFWPLMTTYVNNRRWEDFEDEIGDFSEEDKFSKDI